MKLPIKTITKNRKAYHNYEIFETFEAGLVLTGTEIKSLRNHHVSIDESYIRIIHNEAWLLNASIQPYAFGNINNHLEQRERKLLLHKKELSKLQAKVKEKGLTLIPISMYLKGSLAKLQFGLAKGKKLYDKRHALKEKDEKRKIDRVMKGSYDN